MREAVFCYWRRDFRRAWLEHPEDLPEGLTLANDDWLTGLLQLLAALATAIGITLMRMWRRGQLPF